MGFLTPLYLLGLAAISLPILFHMIRRVPRGRYPFSSTRFLTASPPTVTRRSRIEHWLLLLLRAAAICLLAFAFARPYLRDANALGVDPSRADRTVVLIDTSASMRRDGVWTQVVERAAEAMRQADLDDTIGVYAFDRDIRPVMTMDEWSQLSPEQRGSEAERRLGELQPSWGDTRLDSALTAVADLLSSSDLVENSTELTGARRVVLISDLQEGSHVDALQGFDWPTQVSVLVRQIQPETTGNASLEWIQNEEYSDDSNIVKVRIHNIVDSIDQRFQVAPVVQPNDGAVPAETMVPAGESRVVSLPLELESEGATAGPPSSASDQVSPLTLRLSGDHEAFDNDLYVVRHQSAPPRVLFFGPSEEGDNRSALYFLKKAFPGNYPDSAPGNDPGNDVGGLINVDPEATPPDEESAADMIVVQSVLPEPWIARLREQVSTGNTTALIVLQTPEQTASLGGLLGKPGLKSESRVASDYAMLADIDFQHPLFVPFRDSRFADFTKIRVYKYQVIDASQLPDSSVLAKFDDGSPALIEYRLGTGRVYVLATSWEPTDSQLALSSKFVPLLLGICRLSEHETDHGPFWVGDRIPKSAFFSQESGSVEVIAPDGKPIPFGESETAFTTELPGIYTVKAGGEETRFAVNLHPRESRTNPLDPERLAQLKVRLDDGDSRDPELARESQRQMHAAELESRHKLWRWLALAVLGILVGESFLAGRAARKSS